MKKRLARFWRNRSVMRTLSGWFTNLSAGAVGLIIFTPNFVSPNVMAGVIILTSDITLVIMFLIIAVKLDELVKNRI